MSVGIGFVYQRAGRVARVVERTGDPEKTAEEFGEGRNLVGESDV